MCENQKNFNDNNRATVPLLITSLREIPWILFRLEDDSYYQQLVEKYLTNKYTRTRGDKNMFSLSSAENENLNAHKYKKKYKK